MTKKDSARFSRRHQTNEAHVDAVATHRAKQAEKLRFSQERQEVADKRSPEEQIRRLNEMFGKNVGAVKERAKLKSRIAAKQEKRIREKKNESKEEVE